MIDRNNVRLVARVFSSIYKPRYKRGNKHFLTLWILLHAVVIAMVLISPLLNAATHLPNVLCIALFQPIEHGHSIPVDTQTKDYSEWSAIWPRRWKLVRYVSPVYPARCTCEGIEGTVVIKAKTDIYGNVVKIKALKGHPLLRRTSIEAVRKWIFELFTISQIPTPIKITVVFHFQLR